MGLVAEFDIGCEHLPLVSVAAAVPEATLVLELQFNHDELPLFVLSVTNGDQDLVEETLEAVPVVGTYTVLGEAGDTRRYQAHPGESPSLLVRAECSDTCCRNRGPNKTSVNRVSSGKKPIYWDSRYGSGLTGAIIGVLVSICLSPGTCDAP